MHNLETSISKTELVSTRFLHAYCMDPKGLSVDVGSITMLWGYFLQMTDRTVNAITDRNERVEPHGKFL